MRLKISKIFLVFKGRIKEENLTFLFLSKNILRERERENLDLIAILPKILKNGKTEEGKVSYLTSFHFPLSL